MPWKTTKGSIEWVGNLASPKPSDHWRALISFPGTETAPRRRYWFRLPPGLTEAKARTRAQELSALAYSGEMTPPLKGAPPSPAERTTANRSMGSAIPDRTSTGVETLKGWSQRWLAARRTRGLKSVGTDESRLRTWVWPSLGALSIDGVSRADVEAWVDCIDEQVREGALSWKTAENAWGVLSTLFKGACGGKPRELRVRPADDNPTLHVAPPDRGARKGKQFLYPSEFLCLVECEDVPLEVRQCYAVAAYLYPRAGELEALHCEDIDLSHASVHMHRARDAGTGEIHETKGNRPRRVPIHPNVLPLVCSLVARAGGKGLLWREFPPWKDRAGQLRMYLARAGITRRELLDRSATEKPMTFHDLRATGITWEAVAGTDAQKILARAGHSDFTTTQIYIRMAESVRGVNFGEPFPSLPKCLFGGDSDEWFLGGSTSGSTEGGGGSKRYDQSGSRGSGRGIRTLGNAADRGRQRPRGRP